MKTTTLARIFQHKPDIESWNNLLLGLGKFESDDEPLSFAKILEASNMETAIWCLRAEPFYNLHWRLMGCAFVREVVPLHSDTCIIECIDAVEQFSFGHERAIVVQNAYVQAKHQYATHGKTWTEPMWCVFEAATRLCEKEVFNNLFIVRLAALKATMTNCKENGAAKLGLLATTQLRQEEIFLRFVA